MKKKALIQNPDEIRELIQKDFGPKDVIFDGLRFLIASLKFNLLKISKKIILVFDEEELNDCQCIRYGTNNLK